MLTRVITSRPSRPLSTSVAASSREQQQRQQHQQQPRYHQQQRPVTLQHHACLLELYKRSPELIMSHGKGCYLYDTQGKKYLDLTAGIAVVALGHAHPIVTEAITAQASELLHTSNLYHNKYAGPLATRLSMLMERPPSSTSSVASSSRYLCGSGDSPTPNDMMYKVFLCNSGTEANEAAIKFARKYSSSKLITSSPTPSSLSPGGASGFSLPQPSLETPSSSPPSPPSSSSPHANAKINVVSFKNAFHGRSMGALSGTPNANYQTPFLPLVPGFQSIPLGDFEAADKLIHQGTCAVFLEPIQGEGGIIPVPQDFVAFLRKKTREVDALLIYDEIQCGLARTGKIFAHHHYPTELAPDILTLAKPLANGIPIGATIVSPNVAMALKPGDHGTTFGGNPFASRVALTVLRELSNPDFLSHVQNTGDYFKSRLEDIMDTSPIITAIRGKGLMLGVQLIESMQTSLFVELALNRGLLLVSAGNNTIRIVPPLIITRAEVDEAVLILEDVVHQMQTNI